MAMSYFDLCNLVEEMKEPFTEDGVEYPDGVFEDRKEYSWEDLGLAYGLPDDEAKLLHYLVQREFDDSTGEPPGHIPSWIHKEYYHESAEGNFEGFEVNEMLGILKWLDDMSRYWKVTKTDESRDPVTGRTPNTTYGSALEDQ